MSLLKKAAYALWKSGEESFLTLSSIAKKSLFLGPVFYGMTWLSSHHGPTHEMWMSFFLAAYFFTSTPKLANKNEDKDSPPKTSSPIILPASLRHGRDDFR